MTTKNSVLKANRPAKKPKTFLDTNGAVELANSIAGLQEEKASSKVSKRRNRQELPSDETKAKPKQISAAKARLKETKARIAAERAIFKKAKRRPKDSEASESPAMNNGTVSTPPHQSQATQLKAKKKRVSFA